VLILRVEHNARPTKPSTDRDFKQVTEPDVVSDGTLADPKELSGLLHGPEGCSIHSRRLRTPSPVAQITSAAMLFLPLHDEAVHVGRSPAGACPPKPDRAREVLLVLHPPIDRGATHLHNSLEILHRQQIIGGCGLWVLACRFDTAGCEWPVP
jgi:hypothetical protein